MDHLEKTQRQNSFNNFKSTYEYYDLTPSIGQIQAFEQYVSGEINAEQLQRTFHKLRGTTDKFMLYPMSMFY
jgi:hypothetical protein